jgi:hypothetical protein
MHEAVGAAGRLRTRFPVEGGRAHRPRTVCGWGHKYKRFFFILDSHSKLRSLSVRRLIEFLAATSLPLEAIRAQ